MDINSEVYKAFEVIQNGGIILYPTDTVWGIGCDATNAEAVKVISEIFKTNIDGDLYDSERWAQYFESYRLIA